STPGPRRSWRGWARPTALTPAKGSRSRSTWPTPTCSTRRRNSPWPSARPERPPPLRSLLLRASRAALVPDREEKHDAAEDQQDDPPDQVDVDVQRAVIHLGVAPCDEPEDRQRHADEREHEANRPADIETHDGFLSTRI